MIVLPRPIRARLRKLIKPSVVTLHGLRVRVDRPAVAPNAKSFYKETYEQAEIGLLRQTLRPGDRVVEIGAGVGLTAMVAARIVGAENVVGYEANPEIIAVARENAALNGLAIDFRNEILVSGPDAPDSLPFHVNRNFISSTAVPGREGAAAEIQLPTASLEALIADWRPTVLSLDIEGFEVTLLGGLAEFGPVRAIVMELHDHVVGRAQADALEARLDAAGFRPVPGLSADKTRVYART